MSSLRLWILGCITLSPLLIKSLYDDERDVVYRLFCTGLWCLVSRRFVHVTFVVLLSIPTHIFGVGGLARAYLLSMNM